MKQSKYILRSFTKANIGWLLLNFFLLIASGTARTFGAGYVDQITVALQNKNIEALLVSIAVGGLLMAGSYVLRWITAGICTWLTEKLAVKVRLQLMEHLERLPFLLYEKSDSGKLQSLLRNDVSQASYIIYIEHSRILTNVLLFVIATGYMITIKASAAFVVATTAILLGIINQKILKKLKIYEKNARIAVGKVTGTISNLCSGIDTVKTYRAQKYMRDLFNDGKSEYNNSCMKTETIDAWRLTLYNIISYSAFYVSVVYLGILGVRGKMSLGEILVFLTLLRQIMTPIETVFRWMATMVRSTAAWDRIDEFLQIEEKYVKEMPPQKIAKNISVSGITYAYPGKEPTINEFGLTLNKGKITVLRGKSGSGKTTLLKILLGLYDCASGTCHIDSSPTMLCSLANYIAFTSADCQLFNMSIFENISLGNPIITRERCKNGFERLGMWDWIESLPMGLDTMVDEGGDNLSGGQQQILAVLRAILSARPVLIFDEPFSALDHDREQRLLQWLDELKHNHLILFVTHRQSTVRKGDQVIVL